MPFMLSVVECHIQALYAECRYANCRYAERRYAECRSAQNYIIQTLFPPS